MAAAMREEDFVALQSLLKASSKDAVRQLCQECFSCPPGRLGPLALFTSSFPQLVSALHSLTRHVVFCGLTGAEDILALFPENFHQNLKNLLTKIILENVATRLLHHCPPFLSTQ
uniref:COMM domain containing 9 n=1 Tax=Phasianus colchicus TaxID=9054 RepID=A0A669PY48_PHACC